MREGREVSNWAVCVGITGVDVWKDQTLNRIFVRTHLCLCFFLCCYVLSSFLRAASFSHSNLVYTLQPSSPGDYYSSVDNDLKVELTEKLFNLDTEGDNGPANTEVCISLALVVHLAL